LPVRRTLIFIVGGLLLAGVIHIATVLIVPFFARNDAWSAVARFGREGQFHVLPVLDAGNEPLPALDPRMLYAVCRFTLAGGPVRIEASLPDDFWSVAVFDRRGRNVYSLNDRSAEGSELDLAVITPVQMALLRQDPPASLESAVVVELPIAEGFVVIRVFVADDTQLPGATAALGTADCAGSL
jgi:uncharacterized membrane protein